MEAQGVRDDGQDALGVGNGKLFRWGCHAASLRRGATARQRRGPVVDNVAVRAVGAAWGAAVRRGPGAG